MLDLEEQDWDTITVKELRQASSTSHKWKSPGLDKALNFWLHFVSVMHESFVTSLNKIITSTENWLTQGNTYLLPKSKTPRIQRTVGLLLA